MTAALTIEDLRQAARRRLPRAIFDFVDGGAQDERTLAANRRDFDELRLVPRVLAGVAERSQSVTVLGARIASPLILAPAGLAGALWPRGEVLAAQAARRSGAGFCLSAMATCPLEDVAEAAPGAWFQLYLLPERAANAALIRRAQAAGFAALCVTVDLPVPGRRERDLRSGLAFPFKMSPRLVADFMRHPRWTLRSLAGPRLALANLPQASGAGRDGPSKAWRPYHPGATWADIEAIRRLWPGPLIVKGILSPLDARAAVEAGADAVVVSNHGGRQLDGVVSSIQALPDVVDAVRGDAEVLFDGGIRRGTDAIKALALGATACLIGRAYLYGLAGAGRAGVEQAISILREDIDASQALLGVADLSALDRGWLRAAPPRTAT